MTFCIQFITAYLTKHHLSPCCSSCFQGRTLNTLSKLLWIPSSLPSLVTVCPCNVRGNCKMPVKQLQGMPTIQSAVGILLGTFAVIGKKMQEAALYVSLTDEGFFCFLPRFMKFEEFGLKSLSFFFRNDPRCCVCEAVLPKPQRADQKQPGDGPAEDRNLRFLSFCSAAAPVTLLSAANHRWEQQRQNAPSSSRWTLVSEEMEFLVNKSV